MPKSKKTEPCILQVDTGLPDRERDLINEHDQPATGAIDREREKRKKRTLTTTELAEYLGLAVPSIYGLQKRGVLKRQATNAFDGPENVLAYMRYRRIGAADTEVQSREKTKAEHEVERLNLTRAQVEYQQRRNEILRAQYVARAEVEAALAPVIADLQEFMRENFEGEFPSWCVGKTAPIIRAECQRRLDDVITRVRDGGQKSLDAAEAKARGAIQGGDDAPADGTPDVLRSGRKKEPESRRSQRAKRHAAEGRPASGRKPKSKK